jgi:hypothetical protein
MRERIDVPPPSDVDSAIMDAQQASVTPDRTAAPDTDQADDDGDDLDSKLRNLLRFNQAKADGHYGGQ